MTMKRILSVLLIAVLLVASLGTVAFAAESDAKVVFSGNTKTTTPGSTVTLTFSVNGNGLTFSNYSLSSVSIETSKITISGSSITMNTSTGKAGYASGENTGSHSFTISFNVAADTPAGEYTVTASVNNVRNTDGETQPFAGTATGTIIVEKPACEHNWGAWTVTKAPTCTEQGTETRTCSLCGETETREVAATGHSWGAWTVTTAPTCTEKGTETRTCSVCGETETREIATIAHSWGAWKVTKAATCTVPGEETRTCSVCGETETRAINPGHTISEVWEKDKDNHWHVCTVCGEIFDCAAHTYPGSWTVGKEATETEDGWKYKNCEVCGWQVTDKIPAGLDDVAETGDITGQVTMGAAAVLAMLFAAVAFVFKRKFAK